MLFLCTLHQLLGYVFVVWECDEIAFEQIRVIVPTERGPLQTPLSSRSFVRTLLKPQSHQACDQVTTYLRPKNGQIVERTYDWCKRSYDWGQMWWLVARGKSVATRSYSCSKPGHNGLTTRLRPNSDRQMLE